MFVRASPARGAPRSGANLRPPVDVDNATWLARVQLGLACSVPDRAFDVTYGTVEQLKDISDTRRAFFEPVSPIVDPLLLQYFRADVSVTLTANTSTSTPAGSRPSSPPRPAPTARADDGPPHQLRERKLNPSPASRAQHTTRQGRRRCLPIPGEDGAGVPGAVTPWADGLGDGGEMERWAERRAEKRHAPETRTMAGGAPADEYAYVSCMCVKDEFRRRGVADALLRAAEKVALEWGYDCAALHVFRRNEAAIALYRGRGYEIVDDSCSPVDAILGKQRYLMVKKLR